MNHEEQGGAGSRADQDGSAGQETGTRERVLQAARRLFGERGYKPVTVREIAAEAGVSPAMVMKVGGSKAKLYAAAAPLEPAPVSAEVPDDQLGELLVRRMLDRRREEAAEPWLRAIYLVHDAPDPERARKEFRERFLDRWADTDAASHRRADMLACLMLGLAAGIRTFRLLPPETTDLEAVVAEYGALAQQLIDGIAAPAAVEGGDAAPEA